MTTVSLSSACVNLGWLIEQATETHVPITIAGPQGDAVLISAEAWAAIQRSLGRKSIPDTEESSVTHIAVSQGA